MSLMNRRGSLVARVGLLAIASLAVLLTFANRVDASLPPDAIADRVVIDKSARTLTLYRTGRELATYPVSLGRAPIGPKESEGDRRTPEGTYVIDEHRSESRFHRALHISYPRPDQIEAARAQGIDPGSAIMIHGLRNGLGFLGKMHRIADWTAGCIAVTNPEMDAIFDAVPDGTPIEIRP